jgi:hypothetical protein
VEAIQKKLTLVSDARACGTEKRSLSTDWITRVLSMLQHLGHAAFTHAEFLQEIDKVQLAELVTSLDVDMIARDIDGLLPTYSTSKAACFIPSTTWLVKASYQQLATNAKTGNEANVGYQDRNIGFLVFGMCWAYHFTTGKIINAAAYRLHFNTMAQDLSAEVQASKGDYIAHQLESPSTTRLNIWDHHLITEIEAGTSPCAFVELCFLCSLVCVCCVALCARKQ